MALWTPKNIPTALWLDAADFSTLFDTTSGGASVAPDSLIARWEDKSGNGWHVTQATSAARPTRKALIQNELDVVRFDGTDRMINSSISIAQPDTVFVVSKVDSVDADNAVFLDSLNSSQHVIYRGSSGDNPGAFVAAGGASQPLPSTANTNFNIHAAIFNGSSGLYVLNGGTSTSGAIGSNSLDGISIGNLRGNPNPLVNGYALTGDVAEVIVIASAASTQTRQIVEGYLAWKWNLKDSLPANHPFKYSAPGSLFKRGFVRQYKSGLPPKPRNYGLIRNRDPDTSSLRQGLVAAYCPSISGQGNVLPDLVGGNHGTLTNMDASDWVSSQYGRALDFDGVNDLVSFATIPALSTIASQSFWFRRGGVSQHCPGMGFGVIGSSANRFVIQVWSDGVVYISFGGSNWGSFASNDLNWHHIAAVYDGSQSSNSARLRVWFDGSEVSLSYTGTIPATIGNYTTMRIGQTFAGAALGADPFGVGLLDSAMIYNRALTESEIKLLASKRGIGLEPRKPKITFTDLGVKKNYSLIRVKDSDGSTLREGLVGAWCPSLPNGGSGNTLPDQSGRGNHGVLTNMGPEDWVASEGGRALDFDGVNDLVIVSNNIHLNPTNAVSLSCWIKLSSPLSSLLDFVNLIVKETYVTGDGYFLAFRTDQPNNPLTFRINGFNTVNSLNWNPGSFFDDYKWHHVCATYNKVNMQLYVDGVQRSSAAYTSDIAGNTNAINLMTRLTGNADDIRVYSRALTESEIRLLASRRGIGLQNPRDELLFHQLPSGSSRRLLLTGQT